MLDYFNNPIHDDVGQRGEGRVNAIIYAGTPGKRQVREISLNLLELSPLGIRPNLLIWRYHFQAGGKGPNN